MHPTRPPEIGYVIAAHLVDVPVASLDESFKQQVDCCVENPIDKIAVRPVVDIHIAWVEDAV